MARPRIFVSSTYYDLKHIRASLEAFIDSMGYESVLFESGDIPFRHDQPLDESCYQEIDTCHMLVLIVGGRYGSAASEEAKVSEKEVEARYKQFNSITKNEYEAARTRDVPIFIFVDKNVLAEYETFKRNRDNSSIQYAYVDSLNIFLLLDDILAQGRNNYIRGFEKFDDISLWLRDQWAGLFSDFLSKSKSDAVLSDLSSQISELREVASVLRSYNEAIIKNLEPNNTIISEQHAKLLAAQISHFSEEPMIVHLLTEWLPDEGGTACTPEALYDAFATSDTIENALLKVGADRKGVEAWLGRVAPAANSVFGDLKMRYFDTVAVKRPVRRRSTSSKSEPIPVKVRSRKSQQE